MFEPEPGRFFNHAEARTASRALADLCPRNAGRNRRAQRSSHAAIGAATDLSVRLSRLVLSSPPLHYGGRRGLPLGTAPGATTVTALFLDPKDSPRVPVALDILARHGVLRLRPATGVRRIAKASGGDARRDDEELRRAAWASTKTKAWLRDLVICAGAGMSQ